MKKIILQHWLGPMNELTLLSTASISEYAERIGADYKLLRGEPFMTGLTSPCQKVAMLNKEFDEYDEVCMMDPDMFTVRGLDEDVFRVRGYGRHYGIQDALVKNLGKRFPLLGSARHPYWGGSIYKFPRHLRQALREQIVEAEVRQFSGNYEDEGIMHRLAVRLDMPITEETYMPEDHWNMSSFQVRPEVAKIIHIRPKFFQGGPKVDKMLVYDHLKKEGII